MCGRTRFATLRARRRIGYEPFSALDADLREQLRAEFRQRIAEAGMTAILVTHDEQEARAMAGRRYVLESGRLVVRD